MEATAPGLTRTGLVMVGVITALSAAHHVDHIIRDVTGWPLGGDVNPFSASLLVYPVILVGVLLSHRERVGARFWLALAAGGAVFVLVVHVGPAAGDSVSDIPGQHSSAVADVISLVVLAAFLVALIAHVAHEWGRLRRGGTRAVAFSPSSPRAGRHRRRGTASRP